MKLANLFRWALAAQAVVLLVQAFLAGSALAGSARSLALHRTLGGVALLLAIAQVGIAVMLWRASRATPWLAAANIAFLVAAGAQMAAGRVRLFALHLPLGVALFGAAVALSTWRWSPSPGTVS
jgi:hypothetical protein